MNEENNNPWENTNNNGMTDNTIYVQPSQTDDAAGAQNTAGTDAGPQPMPSSDNMYRFQNTNPGGGQEITKAEEKRWYEENVTIRSRIWCRCSILFLCYREDLWIAGWNKEIKFR